MTALTTIEVHTADGRSVAAMPRMRLRVTAGADQGATFTATSERVVIGAHERADLVLADKTVSRFHCELAVSGDRVELRDLGSRNGTQIDGVRVLHAVLHAGARITIGATTLVYELDADVQVPLAESFGSLEGRSLVMRAAFARLERAAASDVTVLIEGETGTGKEAAAEGIHAASARRSGPFIVVDCGAIPRDLLESELFGHEKGAFTGAVAAREGAFRAAHGGTLFLDEIGELDLQLQPKLLRALEKHEVKPVGTNTYVAADVRVVAATNRDLRAEVNAKSFRADLYYRLAVVEIRMPPLREHLDDLPLLVARFAPELGRADLLAQLAAHPWAGNVRELRNYLERCVAMGAPEPLAAAPQDPVTIDDLRAARDAWERRYLETLLVRHGGNVSAAARAAGVDRKYLYKLLWRNQLK